MFKLEELEKVTLARLNAARQMGMDDVEAAHYLAKWIKDLVTLVIDTDKFAEYLYSTTASVLQDDCEDYVKLIKKEGSDALPEHIRKIWDEFLIRGRN
jgi:hypothetical protein